MNLSRTLAYAWASRVNAMLGATPALKSRVTESKPFQVKGSTATYRVEVVQITPNLFDASLHSSNAYGAEILEQLKRPFRQSLCGVFNDASLEVASTHRLQISRYSNLPYGPYRLWNEALAKLVAQVAQVPAEDAFELVQDLDPADGELRLVRQPFETGLMCEIRTDYNDLTPPNWNEHGTAAAVRFLLGKRYNVITVPGSTHQRIQVALYPR